MTLTESIVLGIVQGLTEFLPISSTAHLRVVPALLGWRDPGAAYSAVIQIGTVVAVLIYFRNDLLSIVSGVFRGLRERAPLSNPEAKLGWYIAAGTVPIVFFGLLLEKWIKSEFRSLWVIAGTLIVLGLLLGWADKLPGKRQGSPQITLREALLVGLAQAAALIPGVSRSGSTITAGLFLGMTREAAARFSFLLSVPAITAAGLKESVELFRDGLGDVGVMPIVVGTLVSFGVGYAAIAGLLAFLRNNSVIVFVLYRVVLGLALIALLASGVLEPHG